MFIRRIRKSIDQAGILENTSKGSIIVLSICTVSAIIFPFSSSMFLFSIFPTAFFVWFSSLFLMILRDSGSINGSEIHLMKSSPHQAVFILNSRGGKKDRKTLTKSITCVEVTKALNNTRFDINIWIGQIYYKFFELEEPESMKLANSIADWLDVPLYCRFSKD